jgi:hypothetical protein
MTPCFLTVFRKLVKVNGGQVESVHWTILPAQIAARSLISL